MLEMKGGATANSGPAQVCSKPSNDSAVYSQTHRLAQARSGPAPLHLLVDVCRCQVKRSAGGKRAANKRKACTCVPTVVRVQHDGSTFVGVRNAPFGFGGSRALEFIGKGHKGADAHEAQLWAELRRRAWAEHDRLVRRGVSQ